MPRLGAHDVRELVGRAYQAARTREIIPRKPSGLVYLRSRGFVDALAQQFRLVYPATARYVVFAGRDRSNRAGFGREEFMGDVSVCETGLIPEGHRGVGNAYVKRALWMVESEFDAAPKAALADFIKFVAGSAAQKLFVAPMTARRQAVLEPLAFPARHCTGEIFAALVPHPRSWPDATDAPEIYQWREDAWTHVRPLAAAV